jgi:acetylglutamate kinase
MKNKLEIIKIGGNLIDDEILLNEALEGFKKCKNLKILVHGGGASATKLSKKIGIIPKMVGGRRVTKYEDLEVVTMVYAGLINKSIVAKLQHLKVNAMGLSGCDSNTIRAKKRTKSDIDYGFVGDIERVNVSAIELLLKNGITPVFTAITHNGYGQLLNTNADSIAAHLAIALSKMYRVRLVYCFEKNGVLMNEGDENSVIPKLNKSCYLKYKKGNKIYGGMIPKLDNCFDALQKGVSEIMIGKPEIMNNSSIIHTKLFL